MEWILIVVRGFCTFSHPFADLALRNAFLGVLGTIFALLPPESISLTFLKQKKVMFWEQNQAASKNDVISSISVGQERSSCKQNFDGNHPKTLRKPMLLLYFR